MKNWYKVRLLDFYIIISRERWDGNMAPNIKVLCVLSTKHEQIMHIKDAFLGKNIDVEIFIADEFSLAVNYWSKKIDRLLLGTLSKKNRRCVEKKFIDFVRIFKPDKILYINTPLSLDVIKEAGKYSFNYFWFVDPLHDLPKEIEHKPNVVATYDIDSFYKYHKVEMVDKFVPLGYNVFYKPTAIQRQENVYDIVFVGSPYKKRLKLLEKIAEQAYKKGWRMKVCGPFWQFPYFWKKYLLKYKYPYLARTIDNGVFSSEQLCRLYNSAKICLNIHNDDMSSLNPRTYDILATKSFMLTDERAFYDGMEPGREFVTYTDDMDVMDKISECLGDDELREKCASQGYAYVVTRRSVFTGVCEVLGLD